MQRLCLVPSLNTGKGLIFLHPRLSLLGSFSTLLCAPCCIAEGLRPEEHTASTPAPGPQPPPGQRKHWSFHPKGSKLPTQVNTLNPPQQRSLPFHLLGSLGDSRRDHHLPEVWVELWTRPMISTQPRYLLGVALGKFSQRSHCPASCVCMEHGRRPP